MPQTSTLVAQNFHRGVNSALPSTQTNNSTDLSSIPDGLSAGRRCTLELEKIACTYFQEMFQIRQQ